MDTIFAPITPVVTSSVIVVRISGSETLKVLSLLAKKNGDNYCNIESRKAYFGVFKCTDDTYDEVLFTYFKAPNSYTGEDVLEVSFHGNPLIVRSAVQSFIMLGFRVAEPGEFTKRAFLNGKLDLTQAEAVLGMIESKTNDGVYYSYEQLKGSLKKEIESIKNTAIDLMSVVEAYVDFPEEELDERELNFINSNLDSLESEISSLIDSYSAHKILKDGYSICIVGKPNVGKSSMMNAILEEERSLVSDIAGTTRDYIDAQFHIDGVPVTIIDTAGVRFTDDVIETKGIERAMDKIRQADLVLVVLDVSKPLDDEDMHVLSVSNLSKRVVIGNKCDLGHDPDIDVDIMVSMKKPEYVADIIKLIKSNLEQFDSEMYGKNVITSERQMIEFKRSLEIVKDIKALPDYNELDIVLFEMERFMSILTGVTGERYTEQILDNVFENFCIGK